MVLKDPFAVYNAAKNVEAHMLRNMLVERGIEAYIVEDNSPAGIFQFGTLAEIHRPQVWIERADIDRVTPLLNEFEKSMGYHQKKETIIDVPVEMTCENCGQQVKFPASERGTVQECPNCSAYLDVGGGEEDWEEPINEDATESEREIE